jgi:hypothetical protein
MRRRLSSRLVAVVVLAMVAAIAARVAAPAPASQMRTSSPHACGVERWLVKTLQDRPKLLRVKPTTVARLVSFPQPTSLPRTRLPIERHIYSVVAAVTLVRREADQDLHLVLQSGQAHMIAEAPNAPVCTPRATAYRKRQMRDARRAVRVCQRARVVGVAFFDFKHAQTGVAPNAIELHPILGFACLS